MEMLIIGVVAIVAFAAVLIPLFRRGGSSSGSDEFADGSTPIARPPAVQPDAGPGEPLPRAARAEPPQPPSEQPPGDAVAADPVRGEGVIPPMAAGPGTPVAPGSAHPTPRGPDAGDELELEIERYRAALRAGTICGKCGQANPADSVFCFECGASLPRAEAREFD